MRVFYSWQSDSPTGVGKAFLQLALERAIEEVAADLDEAERPELDQDTKNVRGSPAIAEMILSKIREADVMVCDVTLTGTTPAGKRVINSNVAIEFGYAFGQHGPDVLLNVMNTYFGGEEELPFDLRHRRRPITYNIDPSATKAEVKQARDQITADLVMILRSYVDSARVRVNVERTRSTTNPGVFWREEEYLVDFDTDESDWLLVDPHDPLCYLRVCPTDPVPQFTGKQLAEHKIVRIGPLFFRDEYTHTRNKRGAISYAARNGQLSSATQVFRNREIWGIEARSLRPRPGKKIRFIPTELLQKGMIRSLGTYVGHALLFDYSTSIYVEGGLVNASGYKLAMSSQHHFDRYWGPILDDSVVHTDVIPIDDEEGVNGMNIRSWVDRFLDKVFDAAGRERPENM